MNIFIQYFNKLRSISPKFDIMPNTNYLDFIPQKSDVDTLADDLDKVRADFAAVLKQFNDEIIPYGFQDASRRQGSESPGA
ncbi:MULTISPECIES: hypothetical protein [Photorhabdus]|uniref:Uncharacterized protein n=3 Tax=Photorhabdus TaxID=29487 RepID=A0AAW6BD68_9GAMM|nr:MULTISPECIES: hypothetical protein [Photorhabdus]MDB6370823.1 hypothetical protein [Photorhabdus bodei]